MPGPATAPREPVTFQYGRSRTMSLSGWRRRLHQLWQASSSARPAPAKRFRPTLLTVESLEERALLTVLPVLPATSVALVQDLAPGAATSNPANLTNVGGALYFTTTDSVSAAKLWKTDGTADGTVLLKDFTPGTGTPYLANLTNVNGTLYFAANDGTDGAELWK